MTRARPRQASLRAGLPAAVVLLGLLAGAATAQQRRGSAPPLPPLPLVAGSLAVRIAYPQPGALVTASDSTFLFGSVGHGRATLTVNGAPVPVARNGAFLAWIALPPDTAPVIRLVARLGSDSAVGELPLRTPARRALPDSGLWLDAASISPRGMRWAAPGEPVTVSVIAAPGASVRVLLPDGRSVSLAPDVGSNPEYGPFDVAPTRRSRAVSRYAGVIPAMPLGGELPPVTASVASNAGPDTARAAWIEARDARGVVRALLPLRLAVLAEPRPVVVLDDDTARAGNTDGAAAATPTPQGTYHWFLINGTPALATGRVGAALRLQLSRTSSAWTDLANVARVLPEGTPPPRTRLRLVRLTPRERTVTARFTLGRRVPFRVDEDGARLTVRLYATASDLDWVQYGGTDPFVPRITWAQPAEDEATVTFELAAPVFGYRARWDGSDLLLEIRRPPRIDRARPLAGRVIAVDPGHPPGGAVGPTGLREAEANLAIARALRARLERAGARVILTRDADTAAGLYERIAAAEAADAELLVSIHNNAFPDGVNPWANHGTSTYYFHPRAAPLAMAVQRGMVRRLGLRDLGVGRGDLALVRATWMPSVLTEGAFLMIPEQEHALRTPAFRRRYAQGVMDGLVEFLRQWGE